MLPRLISHNAGVLQRTGRYQKEGRRGAEGKRPTYSLVLLVVVVVVVLKGTERREEGRGLKGGKWNFSKVRVSRRNTE